MLTVAATAGVILAGVVIGAVAGTCVLATATELTTGVLMTMSPLLLRITVGLFQTPFLGGAMRAIYKAGLTFTMTGMPKLTMLWTNFGKIKDYLANSDFRARLGEAKFSSNWDYDKGPSGGRRER